MFFGVGDDESSFVLSRTRARPGCVSAPELLSLLGCGSLMYFTASTRPSNLVERASAVST